MAGKYVSGLMNIVIGEIMSHIRPFIGNRLATVQ